MAIEGFRWLRMAFDGYGLLGGLWMAGDGYVWLWITGDSYRWLKIAMDG